MNCPVCKSEDFRRFTAVEDEYLLLSCGSCDHVYLDYTPLPDHVATIYSDDYFEGGKAGYPDYIQEESLHIKGAQFYSNVISELAAPGHMLDIGCAAGFLLKAFQDRGWKVQGVEPNLKMARYGRDRFGFDVTATSFESYISKNEYDLITMIQVIAHFYDVRKCIEKTTHLLKRNGLLLIETWDKDSLTAKIMGKEWHEYSPPSVTNWFTPSTLKMLMAQHGLKHLKYHRRLKKISIRHAKSLLSYKSGQSTITRILEKIVKIFPDEIDVIYPANDLFWMIFKKF
jgi:2-polyprenyl-3-methyl-5-hydroxy-6-metoxy-1,4-benzoquinol methylase